MIAAIIFISIYSILINIIFLIDMIYIPSRQKAENNTNTYFTIFYTTDYDTKTVYKAHIKACCKDCAITLFWSDYLSKANILPESVKIKSIHKGA